MFMDPRDLIPGIKEKFLMQNMKPFEQAIKPRESMIVHIKNIDVHLSKTFEKNLLEFSTKYRALKSGKNYNLTWNR